jgi:hypothetical protein
MREYQRPVRFGTEKVVGFPRLAVTFEIARPSDSSVDDGTRLGAMLRIRGLTRC